MTPPFLGQKRTAPAAPSEPDERRRLLNFAFTASDLLIEVTPEGTIAFAAGAADYLLGRAAQSLIGQPLAALLGPDGANAVLARAARLPRGGRAIWEDSALMRKNETPLSGTLRAFRGGASERNISLAFEADLGAETKQNESGGLADREHFLSVAERHLKAARTGERPLQLTLIEIPESESVDAAICAERVDRFLSAQGAPGTAGLLAPGRYGLVHGEEISGDAIGEQVAGIAAETLKVNVDEIRTGSLAIDEAGLSEKETVKALAYAVNRFAKGDTGILETRSLQESLQGLVEDTVARVASLRSTLSAQALTLRYQPIVALNTRNIVHLEALARMAGGDSAERAVLFAEELGMSEDFDMVVCRMAIDALSKARNKGLNASVAVNLSARSVESEIFVKVLREMTAPHQALRPHLLFEITETGRIHDLSRVAKVVRLLQEDGHELCLDDFGVGETSFAYLRALPVDVIKIDGSFIRSIIASPRDAHLVRSMTTLARQLGARTVAEMVEEEAEVEKLTELGADYGQGYYFGRPQASIDEAMALETGILTRRSA